MRESRLAIRGQRGTTVEVESPIVGTTAERSLEAAHAMRKTAFACYSPLAANHRGDFWVLPKNPIAAPLAAKGVPIPQLLAPQGFTKSPKILSVFQFCRAHAPPHAVTHWHVSTCANGAHHRSTHLLTPAKIMI
jgi:hypothetical protein